MAKMIEEACLEGLNYTIIRRKIKNMYIHIKDGKVIVKVPNSVSNIYIEKFILQKRNWINKKILEQSKKVKKTYKNGEILYVLGNPYIIKLIYDEKKRNRVYLSGNDICFELNNSFENSDDKEEAIKKLVNKYYKYIASQEIPKIMEHLEKVTGLYPLQCNIKNLKATWGICSSKKKISINQNLMAYSRQAIQYVCLHELCHLKYMNHSKNFWNLVQYYMPTYKKAKQELKS